MSADGKRPKKMVKNASGDLDKDRGARKKNENDKLADALGNFGFTSNNSPDADDMEGQNEALDGPDKSQNSDSYDSEEPVDEDDDSVEKRNQILNMTRGNMHDSFEGSSRLTNLNNDDLLAKLKQQIDDHEARSLRVDIEVSTK
jgi:hypothetical protein